MKNKSLRHKDFNTFKFQPFHERISNIDVDIFHKVRHEYESQEENECHFYQAMEKWEVLNLTEGYNNFKKEIRAKNYITLPQLLLSKDHVIEVLLKHLRLKNPLCLQPLLEFVVAVAKDLQKEFYVYYSAFFEVIIDLLNTKDTEQLEWSFTCLAYLFKFLWRPLVKNISSVFNMLLPLLSDSKPDYINNFAAESFAFVARKVKDRKSFLGLLLKTVKNNKDAVSGCGKLLFEVMHGIDGQFHSCAEVVLPFLLESVSEQDFHQNTLFEILEQIIANVILNIHPQKSDLLWKTFLTVLGNLLEKYIQTQDQKVAENIDLILKLVGQSIEYKSGKFLQNTGPVIQQLVKLLNVPKLPKENLVTILQITCLLLLSRNIKLPQEQASSLIRKVLSLHEKELLLYFFDNISDCSSFEILILPNLLKQCDIYNLDNECFHVLTKLLLKKAPLPESGIHLLGWSKYPLDFKESNVKILQLIEGFIKLDETTELFKDIGNYFCSLVCLPHLNIKEKAAVLEVLHQNMNLFIKALDEGTEDEPLVKKLLFLINITVECIVLLNGGDILTKIYEDIIEKLLSLAVEPTYLVSLKALSFLFTVLKNNTEIITMETLLKVNGHLEKNFSSPYHEVRLLTTHIYTAFEGLPEFKIRHSQDPEVPAEDFKVFTICHTVESIDPQVSTYRDQIQNLEKLSFDKQQMTMCNQTDFKTIPLRYLCGTLYMNFQLLWEPVVKIIETHAHGLDINVFWNVFGEELRNVCENIINGKEVEVDLIATECEFVRDVYESSQKLSVKPDFINYRLLLWKTMTLFPGVAEAKTRDVSELLLKFIEVEYMKSNSEMASVCNIKEYSSDAIIEDTLDEDPNEQEDENIVKKNHKLRAGRSGGKANLKTLIHKLQVFSKVRSPLSMYKEPDLYKLYFDLLQHKNPEIQKAALDCIMTYKHKYLTPYKDNLYNLVDEKNFKNEITLFRVDKESNVVLAEHRENLVPIVMQIVFSKMIAKTGLRTGGKSSGQMRRSLILRFLAGCEEAEMIAFVQKAFRFYAKYLHDDPEILVASVSETVDLEKIIPPKKLQSSINLLNVILDQFGGLMGDNLLTFLLKILYTVGAVIRGALDQVANIHSGYLAILRNLRTSCVKIVEKFFEHFDHYPWSSKQINALFNVFVWPYLDKLKIEGIHSPTTLLKLFKQWGSNPRYFPLLVKYKEGDRDQYILPHIVELLVNEKSNPSVVNSIQEIIENMLKLKSDEEDLQLPLPVDNLLPVAKDIFNRIELNNKLNYGSCILLPHVPTVLEKIKRRLEGKNKNLNQKELFILSRISELVWEADISDTVLKLLLPVVLKKCFASEEVLLQFLQTVSHLIQNLKEPQVHLNQISPLFAEVSYPSCRKLLSSILDSIATKSQSEEIKTASYLINELNAWDAKWLDQPDFERRHNAFKNIQEAIAEDKIDVALGVLLIYNFYFLIKSEKDLSLRENSSHCLKELCPVLVKKYQSSPKEIEYILNDTILRLIRNGMKSKQDNLRNECISLLGHLARECPEGHFILRDLNKYTNKIDLEVDFFENLTHIQLHRHARGLLKFCHIAKEDTVSTNPRTLTQFILPLASFYLCSEKYASKNSVIDAAIETVGIVCKMLPWHQYEGILKYYLGRLRYKVEFQKQLVRLTVAILDAFHFDLSKGHVEKVIKEAKENIEETISEVNKETEAADVEIVDNKEKEEIEVDEALENDVIDELEDEYEEEVTKDEIKICDKITVLCKSTATRVIRTIQVVLLPQLHKSLAVLTQHDSSHKINRKKTGFEREEEDLLRVPISLAVVKLLQRLPKEILDLNLPGVFMKLCTFLKSQLESVRRITRETLQKIILTLGPKYLGMLLSEMSPLLSRGFHVHVLVFTMHGVLNCLKAMYEPTDIDNVLLTVLNLCKADLFGVLSEEKEIAKIGTKTSEAKSTKSYDTLQILATYVTEKCLMDLILPIKQVLENTHSFKTVNKAQEALRYIALGLVDNSFISLESLLKFAYGTASESIPQLLPVQKKRLTEKDHEKLKRKKEDSLIIPKIPGNRTAYRQANVKTSTKVNAHLLVEFGLRVCYTMLKREKLNDEKYKPFVDPFVAIFRKCLRSKHVKLSTLTIQSLSWIMKYDLPSMQQQIKPITKDLFGILHKYASSGLSKGDNFDLVVAAFKAMAVLVRDVKYYTIDTNQLKVLLLYAEQDMHDHDRQATAFNLLKAIIARKLVVPEIHEIMEKVAELSIISELNYVRSQARMVFYQFIMEYPLGNTLEKHLGFYISQMSYEMQYGRESAIEMIQTLVNSFPMYVLKAQSGTLLITLGARLVNDEVPECRKMVADCISSMLKRLEKTDRDSLFEILVLWLKDNNISHRRLSVQLCGIFVTVEKQAFESRLPIIVPLILRQFGLHKKPGQFVKIQKEKPSKDTDEHQRVKDHHHFQVLQFLLKICAQCPSFLKQKEDVESLTIHAQTLLAYPHDWVRLASAQFLGFVLSTMDIDHLASLLANNNSDDNGYLCRDPLNSVKSLTLDLCDQLQPGDVKSDLAEQVIKNLVFVARVLQKVPIPEGRGDSKKINLLWLTKRMRKIVNQEVTENSSSEILRTEVFKWIAGVGTALDLDKIKPVLHHLLAPLVREMITTEEKNAPLRQLAKEVANLLKKKIGMEEYTATLSRLQQTLSVKRAERKRSRNQLAVTDPEMYAQRKIKRQEKKKESKKRKIADMKGKKVFKKRKLVDLEDNS